MHLTELSTLGTARPVKKFGTSVGQLTFLIDFIIINKESRSNPPMPPPMPPPSFQWLISVFGLTIHNEFSKKARPADMQKKAVRNTKIGMSKLENLYVVGFSYNFFAAAQT